MEKVLNIIYIIVAFAIPVAIAIIRLVKSVKRSGFNYKAVITLLPEIVKLQGENLTNEERLEKAIDKVESICKEQKILFDANFWEENIGEIVKNYNDFRDLFKG